ncbi:MAG: DUF1799 domain-containing protein, partial [Sphingomonadales bacterium]
KKLRKVARRWATGTGGAQNKSEALKDLKRFGASEKQIEELEARWAISAAREQIEIAPDEHNPVTLFFALSTQWREGFNGPSGLDYTAVRPTAEMLGLEVDRTLFIDLRTMEAEALKAWRDRKRR